MELDLDKIKSYYERLVRASELLELQERASLEEVKKAYRTLAGRWHPDKAEDGKRAEAEERMKALNEAYALLKAYCERYPIPFGQESLRDTEPLYDHYRRFYHDYFTDNYSPDEEEATPSG
jgi:curved DNA-binding protein CbpA